MLTVFYEDKDIIVVKKPVGVESQAVSSFAPDMVSEIRKHINRLSTASRGKTGEIYVGVIHRLDKPVSGIMVYAKTRKAAAALSKQVQEHQMKKTYRAVICGKPVDSVGNFVDYLLRDGKTNGSKIVDKGIKGAKRAELSYRLLKTAEVPVDKGEGLQSQMLSLVEIKLLTGRHHQIRVQFAGHGLPLWGDSRYNPQFQKGAGGYRGASVALASCGLEFVHPVTGKVMSFTMEPDGMGFELFFSMLGSAD